eukprot:6649259-Karenia_brevis.AAC.1
MASGITDSSYLASFSNSPSLAASAGLQAADAAPPLFLTECGQRIVTSIGTVDKQPGVDTTTSRMAS